MTFGHRWLSRTVAAALLLLAGMAVPVAPAEAAKRGPDLAVEASGTSIPLGVRRKVIYLKVSNLGDETPNDVTVGVYQSPGGLMPISLLWHHGGGSGECDGDFGGFYCRLLPEQIPGPGETADIPLDASVYDPETPYEDEFKVVVDVGPRDANPANNTGWFPLELVDRPGPDLSVIAPDVKKSVRVGESGRLEPAGALNPGETGAVRYTIANQGRETVSGVKVTLRLPEGVTFTRPPTECVVGDDKLSAVCTNDHLTLVPADQDTDPNDTIYSAVELYNLVTTAASAAAPATLGGGTVQVEGLAGRSTDDVRSNLARTVLPSNAVAVRAADVDGSNNRDGFAVVLAAKSSGGGDGGGGGDDGGGLPVTGPRAGLIGGVGLAVLVVGSVMFLAARRRRVILVTPGNGKPAA